MVHDGSAGGQRADGTRHAYHLERTEPVSRGPVACTFRLETRRVKLCGTMGCTLPDRHSGLHVVPELCEPRKRRSAAPSCPPVVAPAAPPKVERSTSAPAAAPPSAKPEPPLSRAPSAGSAVAAVPVVVRKRSKEIPSGAEDTVPSGRGRGRGRGRHTRGAGTQGRGGGVPPSAGQKRGHPAPVLDGKDAAFAVAAAAAKAAAKAAASAKAAQAGAKRSRSSAASVGIFRVDKLIDRRWAGTRWQYLVRWAGFDSQEDTWEDERNIIYKTLLEDFHTSLNPSDAPPPLIEMPLSVT